MRKRIASGRAEARQRELVRHLVAERLAERDLDQVEADRVAGEVGHLPAGDARRDLDDAHDAVVADEQLRERDPVAQPERAHRADARRAPASASVSP